MKLIEAHNHLLTKHNAIVPLHYFSFIISNKQFINSIMSNILTGKLGLFGFSDFASFSFDFKNGQTSLSGCGL